MDPSVQRHANLEYHDSLAWVLAICFAVLRWHASHFWMAHPTRPLLRLRIPARRWVLRDLLVCVAHGGSMPNSRSWLRYHSHVDMQVMTAQGPIIINPKDNSSCPVEYDEDIVMQLSDYYHVRISVHLSL